MKVMIIPEDQHTDQYIVAPVIEAVFDELAITARISVLPEPRLRGASYALDPTLLESIVSSNPMIDLFLLVIDRDCDRAGNASRAAAREAEHAGRMIACVAVEELETWLLALHTDALPHGWSKIRPHCDPKEAFAEPLLARMNASGPGGGRKRAMRSLRGQWNGLKERCPEIKELQARVAIWYASRASA